MPNTTFAAALTRAMARQAVGPVELAQAVGTSRQTVQAWTAGWAVPIVAMGHRVAEALGDRRLYRLVVARWTLPCRACGRDCIGASSRPKLYCNRACRDRYLLGREPRFREAGALRAIAAMCYRCEPEGACYTAACPLRQWSPLPLVADDLVRSVTPGRMRRRKAVA